MDKLRDGINKLVGEVEPKSYSQKKYEDFDNARFYPTESTMDGVRYVGRYHSIKDAFGLDDFYRGEGREEPYKEHSIYKLPDGYYSINPNITSMSFKTRQDLQNYIDKKNPEEHKYGVYFKPGSDVEETYRGRDEKTGKEYDMEAPDSYKKARIDMRNGKSQDLLKKYYNSEMSLDELHDNLIKVHGNIKPAFEWLLNNARR